MPALSQANSPGLPVAGAFFTKVVDFGSSSLKLEIWDTAGQEKYHSVCHLYFRGANAALLVYDITRKVGSPPTSSPRPSTRINGKETEMAPWFMGTTASNKGAADPRLCTSFREPSGQPLTPKTSLCSSIISWYTPYPHSTTISGFAVLLGWHGAITEPAHVHRPSTLCHQEMRSAVCVELTQKDWTHMPVFVQPGLGLG